MSDNIPFDIQKEIIEKVSDVKSLIRFRSVSKQWKSFIDSPEFIIGYGARDTQPHSRILSLPLGSPDGLRYICLEDDEIESFKVHLFKAQDQERFAPSVISPLLNKYTVVLLLGGSHGLLCLLGRCRVSKKSMVVIWNPSISKSFGLAVPGYNGFNVADFGFGVCPVTSDPTVVKILHYGNMPWHAEVFTLSSGVWNVIPRGNLPRDTVNLCSTSQVVIDRFMYWGAWDGTEDTMNEIMVVSFDLITKRFKVIDLPDALTKELCSNCSVSKLRECLVVYGDVVVEGARCCGAWVMQHDSSFRKLFTIGAPFYKILGFRKSGEPIFETQKGEDSSCSTLDLYDPSSQQIKNLGISGKYRSFFMGFDKESLLLLEHSDSHIYF